MKDLFTDISNTPAFIQISAGLVIIQDNKILLEHPTGAKWKGTYGIPKGLMEMDETIMEAAIRETEEELGIKIDSKDLVFKMDNYDNPYAINYSNNDIIYKKIFYFLYKPSEPLVIDLSKLQKSEVDWAGFLTKEEAESKIFWRQKEVLNYLKY